MTQRVRSADLNYLFLRQQVERSRAATATSAAARNAHEELAQHYEQKIAELTSESFAIGSESRREKAEPKPIHSGGTLSRP